MKQSAFAKKQKEQNDFLQFIDRLAIQQEFNSLIQVYERNAKLIYDVLSNKYKDKSLIDIKDQFINEAKELCDFMYDSVTLEGNTETLKEMTSIGKDFIISLIDLHWPLYFKVDESMREAYNQYNNNFVKLFNCFVKVRIEQQKAYQENLQQNKKITKEEIEEINKQLVNSKINKEEQDA